MNKPSCSHQDAAGRMCGKSIKGELIGVPIASNNSSLRYLCLEHYEESRPRGWVDDELDKLQKRFNDMKERYND